MPQTEARIKVSRWDHDEWLALPMDCQWLYDTIRSQTATNHAGVGQLPRRMWANLAADDDSADRIAAALKILTDRLFVLVDDDTDEVLIRSYIRHDILGGPPGMFVAAMGCARATRSPRLRAALHAELLRLDADEIAGRKKGKATEHPIEALVRTLVDLDPNPAPPGDRVTEPMAIRRNSPTRPVDNPTPRYGMQHGMSQAMAHATGAGAGVGDGESLLVVGSVESASPRAQPSTTREPDTLPGLLVGLPRRPTEAPGCRTHNRLPPDQRPDCRGCLKARERWETEGRELAAAQATVRQAAIAACTEPGCENGWVELPPVVERGQAQSRRCACNPRTERQRGAG